MSKKAPLTSLSQLSSLPLLSINSFQYIGGFRIKAGTFGQSMSGWSNGKIGFNKDRHSLFISGHSNHGSIAEYQIPDLVKSNNILDLNITDRPRQDFVRIFDKTHTSLVFRNAADLNNSPVDGFFELNGTECLCFKIR